MQRVLGDTRAERSAGATNKGVSRNHAEKPALAAQHGMRTQLLYLGDHDPSGKDIERVVLQGLRRYAQGADIRTERLAVMEAQIEGMALPTRPTKQTDSKAASFAGRSVEVEAIPPDQLRALVHAAVEALVDPQELKVVRMAEADERRALDLLAADGPLMDQFITDARGAIGESNLFNSLLAAGWCPTRQRVRCRRSAALRGGASLRRRGADRARGQYRGVREGPDRVSSARSSACSAPRACAS